MKRLKTITLLLVALTTLSATAKRQFLHPGITHTQADIDRMRAMIDAQREPYYSAFKALKNDATAKYDYKIKNVRPTSVGQDKVDALLANDGHAALNTALMWRLTDDERYAQKAVEILNNFSGIVDVSAAGTGPLNASKVHLLIEAAELMRDYAGWTAADQQAFKAMLVYPGYSTKQDMSHSGSTTTWYWNAYNFDSGRHGNQELLPMRMMMALGIYLDNDTIYERARRYYLGLPHMEGDLPYVSGPPQNMNTITSDNQYFTAYSVSGRTYGSTPDYGYNGQLRHFIWENGQQQETSRDQGHAGMGVGVLACIAEMAWHQGDDLYNVFDNRLLLGVEWYNRYNLSYLQVYPDQREPWEPTGYTENTDEATFDNGLFIQRRDRSGRWFSKAPNPTNESLAETVLRGNQNDKPAPWLPAYMHYAVRMGIDQTSTDHSDMGHQPSMLWLKRAYDKSMEGGPDGNGWTTDWTGWTCLTKTRTQWMTGDPCTYSADGTYTLGIHPADQPFRAADYDVFNGECSGQNHTYFDTTTGNSAGVLRSDDVDIATDGDNFVVCDIAEGEWLSYTLRVAEKGTYNVYLTYSATASSRLGTAADGHDYVSGTLPATNGQYKEHLLTSALALEAGADVVRLMATGTVAKDLRLLSIRLERNRNYSFVPAEWERTSATATATFESDGQTITVTAKNSALGAHAQWNLTDADYQIDAMHHLFVVRGRDIRPTQVQLIALNGVAPTQKNRHYSLAVGTDSLFVWDLLQDANMSPIVNTGQTVFPLQSLSFYASNAAGKTVFTISDVNFYDESQLQAVAGINDVCRSSLIGRQHAGAYDLLGRPAHGSRLQIVDGKKIVVHAPRKGQPASVFKERYNY